jgi:hypothetical protein
MAIVSLRAVRDVGGTITAQVTIADADITRIVNSHQVLLNVATPQDVFQYFLNRVVQQMVANAKNREREVLPVADIPVT